jgi:hypothetical protein
MDVKKRLIRFTQLALGIDGILHILAFGSSIYEEAWATSVITGFQCFAFFLGIYFLEYNHREV